jgi:hypothetical protein
MRTGYILEASHGYLEQGEESGYTSGCVPG